jgi:sialate O-acetylesterase
MPAQAESDGDSVVVSIEAMKPPAAVRLAWYQTAEPNLMNKAGLPVSAFRTERQELPKAAKRP